MTLPYLAMIVTYSLPHLVSRQRQRIGKPAGAVVAHRS